MTAWEQFVLVAFILGTICAPFVLMVIAGLRESRQTYQVVYKSTALRSTWKDYFVSFDILFGLIFMSFGIMSTCLMFSPKMATSDSNIWFGYLMLIGLACLCFSFPLYIFYLYNNYWPYTKDVEISFDPKQKVVSINTRSFVYLLKDGDISFVEEHTNGNFKMPFSFYRFHINNAPELILTSKMPGVMGIFEYFKNIPNDRYVRWIPSIH